MERNSEGSIFQLSRVGVPVICNNRGDARSSFYMHHKFAIADSQLAITGSLNWTRAALTANNENFIITRDADIVQPLMEEFVHLWCDDDVKCLDKSSSASAIHRRL